MIFKSSKFRGFTIIELLVVIVVIGILSTVATVSYRGIQRDARDSERETDVQIIVAALERYYDENGYYPGGSNVYTTVGTAAFFKNNLNIPVQALTVPSATSPTIDYADSCESDSAISSTTSYHYLPHTNKQTADCGWCDNQYAAYTCDKYKIGYKRESDGSNIIVRSRYGW